MTAAPSPARTARILCIAFSPLQADARVLRQLRVLQEHGEVTTVGYGDAPNGAAVHIQVPDNASSLPQTPLGVARLALRRHKAVELKSPGEAAVVAEAVASGPYDLVVANDARALPLAFAAANGAPVYADMHEWAPEEKSAIFVWRVLVAPYMSHLCRTYLPHTAAVTSVSSGLSQLYADTYGLSVETVRNSADLQELTPSPVDPEHIRLAHSGTADPERNIMELIDAVEELGPRFSLDLYLLEVPGGHLAQVKRRAAKVPQVTVHDPVPPQTLPTELNQYDLGLFLYPLTTLSHRFHLPNKFFDFVQARLGLVFSPAPEIQTYMDQYHVGTITSGTTAQDLVNTLKELTVAQIEEFKQASQRHARALSNEPDREAQSALVARVLAANVES